MNKLTQLWSREDFHLQILKIAGGFFSGLLIAGDGQKDGKVCGKNDSPTIYQSSWNLIKNEYSSILQFAASFL